MARSRTTLTVEIHSAQSEFSIADRRINGASFFDTPHALAFHLHRDASRFERICEPACRRSSARRTGHAEDVDIARPKQLEALCF
ncbi:hypothetical protein KDW07_18115 [Burkholderia dolosa]|uniref:hypothetical protein n=1 Tax=Burkholderia dolosa TaxID=152500 RepID=UPI001B98AC6A|nr:hypothetical protein [Burkholderia dolosa]MBR8459063.1 hypothetical protein [Burkholderia dolosa]MDN7420563.1 hypothetical protein [Burkholderia dolosa]